MDDGHVGAESLRKKEKYGNGNGVTRYWQHKGLKRPVIYPGYHRTIFSQRKLHEYWRRDSPTWCPKPFWAINVVYMERW